MNAERGGRRVRRSGTRRHGRLFGGVLIGFGAFALTLLVVSPRSGGDLTGSSNGVPAFDVVPNATTPNGEPPVSTVAPLLPAEAASTVPESRPNPAGVSSVVSTTGAAAPSTTLVARTGATAAASDLDSYFTALTAHDLVGAFDHLSAQHQVEVGGFDIFQGLWSAPAAVEHEPSSCSAAAVGYQCTINFRIYATDGVCAGATFAYELRLIGTRHRIVEEHSIAQRSCDPLATTTTAVEG